MLKAGEEIHAVDGMRMAAASVRQARSVLLGMQGTSVRIKVFRAPEHRTFEAQLHRGGALGVQKQSMSGKFQSLQTRINEHESVIDLLEMQLSCAQAREAKFIELLSYHTQAHMHVCECPIPRSTDKNLRVCSSTSRSRVDNFLGAEARPAAAKSVNVQPAPLDRFLLGNFGVASA